MFVSSKRTHCHYIHYTSLTFFGLSVTTPNNLTTLVLWNWPMVAASWRNFIFSSSDASCFRVFTATSISVPWCDKTAWWTVPNWPEPKYVVTLSGQNWFWKRKKEEWFRIKWNVKKCLKIQNQNTIHTDTYRSKLMRLKKALSLKISHCR